MARAETETTVKVSGGESEHPARSDSTHDSSTVRTVTRCRKESESPANRGTLSAGVVSHLGLVCTVVRKPKRRTRSSPTEHSRLMSSVHPPEAQQVIADLGRTLRRLRYERNLRLDEMKERSGFHTTAIVRYETGGVAPTFPQLVRLAAALGMSASELVAAYEEDTTTIS